MAVPAWRKCNATAFYKDYSMVGIDFFAAADGEPGSAHVMLSDVRWSFPKESVHAATIATSKAPRGGPMVLTAYTESAVSTGSLTFEGVADFMLANWISVEGPTLSYGKWDLSYSFKATEMALDCLTQLYGNGAQS